jgi:hypothetical protein
LIILDPTHPDEWSDKHIIKENLFIKDHDRHDSVLFFAQTGSMRLALRVSMAADIALDKLDSLMVPIVTAPLEIDQPL